jgi:Fe2+ or Zn2+ uptake regulation protein
MTPQRIAVIREVTTGTAPVPAATVVGRLQASLPGISTNTVHRTLDELEQAGVIVHVHLESGIGYLPAVTDRRVLMVCQGCGNVEPLDGPLLEQLEQLVAAERGFRADLTHHVIAGHCHSCQATQSR